jgi:hypothetical protein
MIRDSFLSCFSCPHAHSPLPLPFHHHEPLDPSLPPRREPTHPHLITIISNDHIKHSLSEVGLLPPPHSCLQTVLDPYSACYSLSSRFVASFTLPHGRPVIRLHQLVACFGQFWAKHSGVSYTEVSTHMEPRI